MATGGRIPRLTGFRVWEPTTGGGKFRCGLWGRGEAVLIAGAASPGRPPPMAPRDTVCAAGPPPSVGRTVGIAVDGRPTPGLARRDVAQFREVVLAGLPVPCRDVRAHLVARRGAGDDAADRGLVREPADGDVEDADAALLRETLERLDDIEDVVGERRLPAPRLDAAALGSGLAAAVLAGQQAAREREVGQHADAVVLERRHEVRLDVALEPA